MMIRACRLQQPEWPTILCIDDDPQIPESISLRLNGYEVNVLSACHGMHGFWLAMTNRPQLVITDVSMPQGAGDYVVDCLRHNSDTREIAIIVLTGLRDPQWEARMRHAGADEYLVKPVHFDQLLKVIEKHVVLNERNWNDTKSMANHSPCL
jgi:DNA-binding response OmpR family regulator